MSEETRHECHKLVDELIDEGLDELLMTLRDLIKFYNTPPLPSSNITNYTTPK